ncbi:hypothetical protein XPA_007658 [Xanthoria parietina]
MFDLGDAHYRLTRRNIQLVARTRIHLSLPSTPIQSPSVQDLLTLGLWITRGNGLGLRIRADFNAFAHSSTGVPHDLHHVLGETLPLAKVLHLSAGTAALLISWPPCSCGLNYHSGRLWSFPIQRDLGPSKPSTLPLL